MVLVLVLDVTEEEADKLLLTLDPLAAMAEADADRITQLLKTVRTEDRAVEDLLRRTAGEELWRKLHPDEIHEAEIQTDRSEELREKWGVKVGQSWQIEQNRIICGDSCDSHTLELFFKDSQAVRSIITDPPYGVSYATKNTYLNRSDRGTRIQKPIANDALTPNEVRTLFQTALRVALAFAISGATCYATVPSGPLLPYFISGFEGSGLSFKHLLVWVKNHFVIGMSDYHYRHEAILYGWLETGPHYFIDDRTQDSVFEVDRPMASDLHPTTKPIELIARMVGNSTKPGEVVYDPFCGSGSTILAAHQLRRIGYGCEIDPGYVAVALERLSLLGLKPELVEK
jgi:DNA modification methylase